MRGPKNKSTGSLFRAAGKLFRIVGITAFLLIILAVVLIVIPVERDMKTRNQITVRVQVGKTISNSLVRFRNENGFWPHDTADYSQNDVEVLSDGLVRVYFRAPESIDGKWADLKISIDNGRYYRSCRATEIKSGRLPAWCREGASMEEVRLQ
jgi:hypothetical protein